MRAIVLERYGAPEVLAQRDVAGPSPRGREISIRVRAAGVNFADLLQRLGLYGSAPRPPYVPGFEVAGEVLEIGGQVSRFRPGDRVVALTRFGGYAEEVCTDESSAVSLPEGMGYETAAALPVNYLTAWFCLKQMGNLQAGERVLIQTAAGGVGTAAVQLALAAGGEVFATAGSEDKVAFLNALGAQHAINYRTADFTAEIRRLTDREGVDLVLDAVGGETLKKGYALLSPLGRLVSYGLSAAVPGSQRNRVRSLLAWWRTPRFSPIEMIGRNVGVFGFHLALLEGKYELVAAAFAKIIDDVAAGALTPVIARTFALDAEGAAAAHYYLHERRNIGKVLLVDAQE